MIYWSNHDFKIIRKQNKYLFWLALKQLFQTTHCKSYLLTSLNSQVRLQIWDEPIKSDKLAGVHIEGWLSFHYHIRE